MSRRTSNCRMCRVKGIVNGMFERDYAEQTRALTDQRD
jgi:hypothetical protein